jgi:hypothetical protein
VAADLLAAIHGQWESDLGLSAAKRTLFDDNPMSGPDFGSYVVLADLEQPEKPDDFEGGHRIDAIWKFRAWTVGTSQAESRAKAEALVELIRSAFQGKPFDMEGFFIVKVRVARTRIHLDETRSTPGRLIHEVEVSFLADLHRRIP